MAETFRLRIYNYIAQIYQSIIKHQFVGDKTWQFLNGTVGGGDLDGDDDSILLPPMSRGTEGFALQSLFQLLFNDDSVG